jgi:hypothetical protein
VSKNDSITLALEPLDVGADCARGVRISMGERESHDFTST